MYESILGLVVGVVIAMIIKFTKMTAELETDIDTNRKLIFEISDRIAQVKHDLKRLEQQLDSLIEQTEKKDDGC